MAHYEPGKGVFVMQPPGLYSAVAVQNEWVALLGTCDVAGNVLTTVHNARVYEVIVGMNTANEDLECQIEADGILFQAVSIPAVAGSHYSANKFSGAIPQIPRIAMAAQANPGSVKAFLIEGGEVCVMIRKITAAGANVLEGIATWGQKS